MKKRTPRTTPYKYSPANKSLIGKNEKPQAAGAPPAAPVEAHPVPRENPFDRIRRRIDESQKQ